MTSAMAEDETISEDELATRISSVVEKQITNHLKGHDDDLRSMRDAMQDIMKELRTMAAVEDADEGVAEDPEASLLRVGVPRDEPLPLKFSEPSCSSSCASSSCAPRLFR